MNIETSLSSLGSGLQTQGTSSSAIARDLTQAKDALAGAENGSLSGEEVGQQFEKLFSTMLVREMRKSVGSLNPEGGMFGKGAGSDIYEGWFDEHVGGALASRNALGLAGMIKANVAHLQDSEAQAAQGPEE